MHRRRRAIRCITGILSLLCALASASAPKDDGKSTLLPIPDATAQYKSRDLIRETFRRDFAARTTPERRALAQKLIAHAVETTDDVAARYVLLCEARDLAASSGDIASTCRAIDLLRRQYDVDEITLTTNALTSAGSLTLPSQGHAALARAAMSAVTRAVLIDDFDAAFRLMNLATSAANKSRDPELIRLAADRAKELRTLKTDFDALQAAVAKLEDDAADPAANTLVGRYRCLVKSDFTTALPYLCKCTDAPLKLVADRASAADATDPFELANLWWDLADAYTGLARRNLRSHAANLYRQSLPKLTGLHRAAAHNRLREADQDAMRDLNLAPGLVAELFKTVAFADPITTRIDPTINFEWDSEPVHEGVPKDNFSIRWTGLLRTTTPGKYTFTTLANTGTRIYLNDKLVLDAPNLTRLRNGTKFTLDLPPGIHPLKVEFWDTTGLARMKILWQTPGSPKEEPIPANHLYHDALVY
jgi:hypothetical protein